MINSSGKMLFFEWLKLKTPIESCPLYDIMPLWGQLAPSFKRSRGKTLSRDSEYK